MGRPESDSPCTHVNMVMGELDARMEALPAALTARARSPPRSHWAMDVPLTAVCTRTVSPTLPKRRPSATRLPMMLALLLPPSYSGSVACVSW